MALSKQDQAYYQEKLGYKYIAYLFATTSIVGAIAFPSLFYFQDWMDGQTGKWSSHVVSNLATEGFLIGSVFAVGMYLLFKFLLEMGWLPRRPRD
jgi:hypothetical protein